MSDKDFYEKVNGNNSNQNYVFFDLNLRASKIKSGYLIKDCINALSSFIDSNTVRYLGA